MPFWNTLFVQMLIINSFKSTTYTVNKCMMENWKSYEQNYWQKDEFQTDWFDSVLWLKQVIIIIAI